MTPDQVKRIRQRLGLTQSGLARLLGVHVITVAKWEAGMQGMRGTAERLLILLAKRAPVGRAARKLRRR